MSHLELLIMLRRNRLKYLLFFVVVFIVSGYFLIPIVLRYEGTSTFYLANETMINPGVFSNNNPQDGLQISLAQERLYHLAYSTEMMLFLINNFKLYDHYNIDTTQINYYAKTARRITENIKFHKITEDLSKVVVNDRNNEIAATIANAVVWKLDQLNRKYLIDKMQVNLNYFSSYIQEVTVISKEQNQKLFEFMEALKRKPGAGEGRNGEALSEVEFSIYQAAAKIQDLTSQLIMAKSLYNNALTSQKSSNLPEIVILKIALPEVTSRKYHLIGYAALCALLACTILILVMYFYFSYQKEFSILFGRGDIVIK